jgi:hypothetical protein
VALFFSSLDLPRKLLYTVRMAAPCVIVTAENESFVVSILPPLKEWTFHSGTPEQLRQELDAVAAAFTSRLPTDRTPDEAFVTNLKVAILWVLLRWDASGAITIPHQEAT